jgi:copper ion binding protein
MTTRTFQVEGMNCSHCQAAVTKALAGVPGVRTAKVDLEKAQAHVDYDQDRVTVQQLAHAVQEAGYRLAEG